MAPWIVKNPVPSFIPLIDDWNWDSGTLQIWSTSSQVWDSGGGIGQNTNTVMSQVEVSSSSMTPKASSNEIISEITRPGSVTMTQV